MGLTVLVPRLPRKWEKVVVCILMIGFVTWSSVLPFLVPALIQNRLSNLTTRFDKNGICRQTTKYTCGPAAAVTALGKLGLSANEGEIAILSRTSPIAGTLPAMLCSALKDRYSSEGLKCQYRRFDSIEQLKKTGVTLAVVKDAFFVDHCLVVLEVLDDAVAVADPVTGVELMPYEKFRKIWRFSGIVMERDSIRNI
jgi:predicted double-glycine peptidase